MKNEKSRRNPGFSFIYKVYRPTFFFSTQTGHNGTKSIVLKFFRTGYFDQKPGRKHNEQVDNLFIITPACKKSNLHPKSSKNFSWNRE